jgi:hypothetical protein
MLKKNQKTKDFFATRIIKSELLYKYKVNTISTETISVHKEILRKKIIIQLIQLFTQEIKKLPIKLGHIFKYNKFSEYVQLWCWHNRSNKDIVIPYNEENKYNFTIFLDAVNYFLSKIIKQFTPISIENSIISNLINKVQSFLKNQYFQFLEKIENKLDIIIKKTYHQDMIKLSDNNNNKIEMHKNLYNRLLEKFNNNNKGLNPDIYIFCLTYRYEYLSAGNQQLAINTKIKEMFKKYGIDFELFGSAINVVNNHYCSLNYDIEKYFGSKGDFFDIEIYQGIYWCNPPYDETIMAEAAKKLIKIMQDNKNVAFLVTIPIWDKYTQKQNFTKIIKNHNSNTKVSDHSDYEAYALLKPFIKCELIIPKKSIGYFNHFENKPVYAANTYMLLIYHNIEKKYIGDIENTFDEIMTLK